MGRGKGPPVVLSTTPIMGGYSRGLRGLGQAIVNLPERKRLFTIGCDVDMAVTVPYATILQLTEGPQDGQRGL